MNSLKNVALRPLICLVFVAALAVPSLAHASRTTSAVVQLPGACLLRVDASDDGSHKAMYFAADGVLVFADVNSYGQLSNKILARYTQYGEKVILRDGDGNPLIYLRLTPDQSGFIHMMRDDGAESLWTPLSN